jgi:serine/threonine protein kinase
LGLDHKVKSDINDIDREITILKMLNHQNIIKFKDLFEENNRIIIVTELAEHGSLKKLIDERILNQQNFEVEEIMNIFI